MKIYSTHISYFYACILLVHSIGYADDISPLFGQLKTGLTSLSANIDVLPPPLPPRPTSCIVLKAQDLIDKGLAAYDPTTGDYVSPTIISDVVRIAPFKGLNELWMLQPISAQQVLDAIKKDTSIVDKTPFTKENVSAGIAFYNAVTFKRIQEKQDPNILADLQRIDYIITAVKNFIKQPQPTVQDVKNVLSTNKIAQQYSLTSSNVKGDLTFLPALLKSATKSQEFCYVFIVQDDRDNTWYTLAIIKNKTGSQIIVIDSKSTSTDWTKVL